MTKVLLIILFFTLPLIHGRIFPTLGIDLYFHVSGNFEFSRALFFNVISWIIFLSFFVEKFLLQPLSFSKEENSCVDLNYKVLFIIFTILTLSTLFSLSPFMSLIWDLDKWHTALMYLNLLWLLIVLQHQDKAFLKKLIFSSLLAWVLATLLAIKELFFQTYDYGPLSNRALWSFWHPNYLAWYLLLLLPYYCSPFPVPDERIQVWVKIIGLLILLLWIFFSQSLVAIILALSYITYVFIPLRLSKNGAFMTLWAITIAWTICLILYAPEKLHSFLSRFYLWQTTLSIIFSDIKVFLIGWWAETLPYYFDSFKVPQVYIYENFGFTADRPHNFGLNIFYHFWIFALWILLYYIYNFFRQYKNTPEDIALLLFLLFWIIHYFSISSYILVVLIIALTGKTPSVSKKKLTTGICLMLFALASLTWGYYSLKLYSSEILYAQKQYVSANDNFQHPKYLIKITDYSWAQYLEWVRSPQNIKRQIQLSPEKLQLCNTLVRAYPSAEHFFYCWNIFWNLEKQDIARNYYISGLKKLPDLWNEDSPYLDNYFVKNTITGNRFFSEKFWDINTVLKKVWK